MQLFEGAGYYSGESLGKEGEDRKSARKEYRLFGREKMREEIFKFSKAIAEYLKKENIKDLVIIDRGSRPLYVGVREYWKSVYPDTSMPGIYFVNPKGFNNLEETTAEQKERLERDALFKDDKIEDPEKIRSREDIVEEFKTIYPRLVRDKDEPILVFDTCIHTGESMLPFIKTMKGLGFADIRIGAVTPAGENSPVATDFFITRGMPARGCYPFGGDRTIEKTFEHTYSQPSEGVWRKKEGRELRDEIKRIMQEYLHKD